MHNSVKLLLDELLSQLGDANEDDWVVTSIGSGVDRNDNLHQTVCLKSKNAEEGNAIYSIKIDKLIKK